MRHQLIEDPTHPTERKDDMEPQELIELMSGLLDAELANFSEARDALLAELGLDDLRQVVRCFLASVAAGVAADDESDTAE
jgi:hypothetical protein